jgi:O-antigen ligase
VITIAGMALLFAGYLNVFNRYNQVVSEITHLEEGEGIRDSSDMNKAEQPNSTNIRKHIWKYSFRVIEKNILFGVGTGDLKDELFKEYQSDNYSYGVQKKPSPHNQFLHTAVILGVTGLIILFLIFILPVLSAIKKKDWFFAFFMVIIFLNCMTESILEREAGILFFIPFFVLLFIIFNARNDTVFPSPNRPENH